MPASRARWMMRMESARSSLPQGPNIIAPRHTGLTWTPVRPSGRYCMGVPSSCQAAKRLLGGRDGGHRPRPAGVERQVGDGLDDLGLGEPVLLTELQVEGQLLGVAPGDQRRDRDEAAVAWGQLGALPHVAEQDVVGERDQLGREVAQHLRRGRLLWVLWHGGASLGGCCRRPRTASRPPAGSQRVGRPYSASVTCSPHSVSGPSSPSARPSQMARWVMKWSGVAPCQCHSPGGHHTVSPGRIATTSPPRDWVRPTPLVTCRVWPWTCRCHAARAQGAKCTALTLPREAVPGAMTSKCTTPVNHSAGPWTDGCLVRISTLGLLLYSGLDEDLERGALVHRPVAVGGVLEEHGAVEDPAGLDPALQHVGQQFLDVGALRAGAAGEGDVAAEQVEAGRRLVVLRDADPADHAACAHDAECLLVGGQVPDALQDRGAAVPTGELADRGDALLAAGGDDVRGAELAAEVGPRLVAAIRTICSAPSRL